MGTKDPRVDAYIEKAAPFAKPILKKLRSLAHKGCPDVVETIKWGMPSFEYKGPFCGMTAFKAHCSFGFWKSAILFDDKLYRDENGESKLAWGAPGHDAVSTRIESVADLPSDDVILALLRRAAKLNDDGVKLPRGSALTVSLP